MLMALKQVNYRNNRNGELSLFNVYFQGLKDLIPNSFVDELENDSSNIIEIISTAYNVSI